MKQKLPLLALFFLLQFTMLSIFAQSGQFTVNNLTYSYDDINVYEVSVKGSSNLSGNIIIPYSAKNPQNGKDYVVTALNDNAFNGCSKITSLTIPKGVILMGNYAFQGCFALKTLHLNPYFPPIANEYTAGNINVAKLTFYVPTGSKIIYQRVWNQTFNYVEEDLGANTAYRTVNVATAGTLPQLITQKDKIIIYSLVLTGKLNGTDILYLREMSGSDIDGNSDLERGVDIGGLSVLDMSGANIVAGGGKYYKNNVTQNNKIGDNMFYNCYALYELTFPNSVNYIGSNAAAYCENIEILKIPNSVTYIGNYAFAGLENLKSVTLPTNLKEIMDGAFHDCFSLESVIIPDKVTDIAIDAFFNCENLKEIVLGSNLINIGSSAFRNADKINKITSKTSLPPTILSEESPFEQTVHNNASLYVPIGSKKDYQSASIWQDFKNIFESTTSVNINTLNKVKVYSSNDVLIIENAPKGESIYIINMFGVKLHDIISTGETININVKKNNIYLVKISDETIKIIL